MRREGLPAGYADALSTGLWPSCDVLLASEKAQQGQALRPETTIWHQQFGAAA
jgi:hypothetical protein